jgi:hypothetical protein
MARKKPKLLVLVGRHGESWPRHVTKDKSLAARWVAHDSPYRSAVSMEVDDAELRKQVEKEERSRV